MTDWLAAPKWVGAFGKAFQLPNPELPAILVYYLIHAEPRQHPLWGWYMVSIVHLRDVPDAPPAWRLFSEATHEMQAHALDPARYPPDPADPRILTPANLVVQAALSSDEEAVEIADLCVRGVVDGHLGLDDGLDGFGNARRSEHWRDAITRMHEHRSTGGHPPR